ncbi:MAG: hypothetical protein GY822_16455 [Deltaproteobacteria bacterium]|nr:hypothetical protein [Deltaproteobacteria bacterium]
MEPIREEKERLPDLDEEDHTVIPPFLDVDTDVGTLRFRLRSDLAPRTILKLQNHYQKRNGQLELVRALPQAAFFHQDAHGYGGPLWIDLDESSPIPLKRGVLVLSSFAPHAHSQTLAVLTEDLASQLSANSVVGVLVDDHDNVLDQLSDGVVALKLSFVTPKATAD